MSPHANQLLKVSVRFRIKKGECMGSIREPELETDGKSLSESTANKLQASGFWTSNRE